MSDASPLSADSTFTPDRSPAAPLFLWLAIQFVALALPALRVPLSARPAPAGERFAVHVVIVAQVTACALLFPFLLRDVKTAVMVALTAVPTNELSGFLSGVTLTRAALTTLHLACWIATLSLWRAILVTRRAQMLGVAVALAWSLGGAVVWYISAEARPAGDIDWSRDGLFGPIMAGIAQVKAARFIPSTWIPSLTLLLLSGIAFARARRRASMS